MMCNARWYARSRVWKARTSRDLAGIYDKILEDLAAQFVVGYVSDNPVRDGRFRKIKVTVKVPGLTVRHRTGYTAREDEVSENAARR